MLFNSLTFAVFFAVLLGWYWALRGWPARKRLLLCASLVFYAAWNPPYLAILLLSISVDWWLARLIFHSTDPRRRRLLLIGSLLCNLSLLGYFKYGDFLVQNFSALMALIGVDYQPAAPGILLPIGISFYTFASLSYTIDVYRREVRGDWSLGDYALFVSLFPHLVAGPIVRARFLLPQIEQPREPNANLLGWGLALFTIGLFAKTVMADSVFAPVVDRVYAQPAQHGALDAWTAILGFSGQIYYDFAGYSLCAIGLALCLGFEFPDNFRHPYGARGFSDFWRRWHISLSSWLRDYLYIPLGGNRGGHWRTACSLMLTMLLGGLWHGASWMYVLWGALHGIYLAAERVLRSRASPAQAEAAPRPALALTLSTFLIVTLTWIPFRAVDARTAGDVLAALWRPTGSVSLPAVSTLLCLLAMVATVAWHCWLRDRSLEAWLRGLGPTARGALLAACLIAIYLCSGGDGRAFIYFQF